MNFIVDSHAWIEYFEGSRLGDTLRNLLIDPENKFITMECNIAELKGYCIKNNIDFDKMYIVIKTNSYILPVMLEHWLKGAEIKSIMRKKYRQFGLIDAVIIAKQKELKCKIITGDNHFSKLKDIVFLK